MEINTRKPGWQLAGDGAGARSLAYIYSLWSGAKNVLQLALKSYACVTYGRSGIPYQNQIEHRRAPPTFVTGILRSHDNRWGVRVPRPVANTSGLRNGDDAAQKFLLVC